MQSHARGEEGPVHRREVLRQWGNEGFQELESLKKKLRSRVGNLCNSLFGVVESLYKTPRSTLEFPYVTGQLRKFILPFACSRGEKGSGIVSWQSPELLAEIEVPAEWVAELRKPLRVSVEQLQVEVTDYAENGFPLELLSTRRDPFFFDDVRRLLCSPELARLIGLAAHLVYWNTFAHLHAPQQTLPEATRQSLVLTMQEAWTKLEELARNKLRKADARAREFFVPVCLLFIKWGIEKALLMQYHKFLRDTDYGEDATTQLVHHINVAIMCLFDPDCSAANFGTLDSSSEASRLWRKLHLYPILELFVIFGHIKPKRILKILFF